MLGYLSADIICSEKRTVFRERSSRKTVSFEEQIMSKDKYPSMFSQPNWGYCVYYPSVLKIGEYPRIFPSFSWGIFAHVTRLDQSRASKNIWWIIINNYSPKWRWIVVDIYRAAKRRGKYPPLFTDTEVNNCFSIYHTSWINSGPIMGKGLFSGGLLRCRWRATRIAVSDFLL